MNRCSEKAHYFPQYYNCLKQTYFVSEKKMPEKNSYCLMISCVLFPVLQLLKPVFIFDIGTLISPEFSDTFQSMFVKF